jgi:bifunctional enzyme CysN/CysC
VTGGPVSANVVWHDSGIPRVERWAAFGLAGATVWFTGLSGSGKSTVATALARRLIERGAPHYLLDGDNLRHGLNGDLGFDEAGRTENVRRVAEVARLFADAGLYALVPVISPYRAGREQARSIQEAAGLVFVEVYMATTLAECERRDPKGLYARARSGELRGMTGIDDPYEPPAQPELVFDEGTDAALAAAEIELYLQHRLAVTA